MNFDAKGESFSKEPVGVCPLCQMRVGLDVLRSWRPGKTGFTLPHEACTGANYEVRIERAELPETVLSALSESIPHGPSSALLAARELRRIGFREGPLSHMRTAMRPSPIRSPMRRPWRT